MKKLAIITTHPIQYQIPLFKNLKKNGIDVTVFFASKHGLNSNKIDFKTLLYMKDGLDKYTIEKIIQKLKINPLELIRTQEKIWKENYRSRTLNQDDVLNILVEYPNLIKRPIFITKTEAIIAIPADEILKIY